MGGFGEVSGDVRWAVRGLGKRPTLTLVAVLTLALGIGSNSAIFTLVSAHFFEPLPYERPEDLVLLRDGPERPGGQHRLAGKLLQLAGGGRVVLRHRGLQRRLRDALR